MGKLVGYSLSGCVGDILSGKVKEEDVERIIANTDHTATSWEVLIRKYQESYWDSDPKRAAEILRRLIAAGKVDEPRTRGEQHPGSRRSSESIWSRNGVPVHIR